MSHLNNSKPFAEVIESSLHGWLAQSWQWDTFPTFGSMVMIENKNNKRTVFGIVHQIQTGSMDPVRYPFAYQKTEEELLKEQPQIFEFLKTTFSCLVLGYQEKSKLFFTLAPEPTKIHAFVKPMPQDVSKQFFYTDQYLHVLFGLANHVTNLDELILATLRYQTELGIINTKKISNVAQTYSLLTGNDYRRLKLFLQRAQHIVTP